MRFKLAVVFGGLKGNKGQKGSPSLHNNLELLVKKQNYNF